MKLCRKCDTTKSLDDFNNNAKTFDGKRTQCKICDADYRRSYLESGRRTAYTKANPVPKEDNKEWIKKWRLNNPDYHKEYYLNNSDYYKLYRLDNPIITMLTAAKLRAKKKGLKFDITRDDIVISDLCPVLGIPMFPGEGKICYNSPSLDRKDNSKGYIKGNVHVISMRANILKRDGTIEELEKIIEYMKN